MSATAGHIEWRAVEGSTCVRYAEVVCSGVMVKLWDVDDGYTVHGHKHTILAVFDARGGREVVRDEMEVVTEYDGDEYASSVDVAGWQMAERVRDAVFAQGTLGTFLLREALLRLTRAVMGRVAGHVISVASALGRFHAGDLRYEVRIAWSDEDECYVATAPDLRYCAAHGDTYEEALYQIKASMQGYIELCRVRGRQLPPVRGEVPEFLEDESRGR